MLILPFLLYLEIEESVWIGKKLYAIMGKAYLFNGKMALADLSMNSAYLRFS